MFIVAEYYVNKLGNEISVEEFLKKKNHELTYFTDTCYYNESTDQTIFKYGRDSSGNMLYQQNMTTLIIFREDMHRLF